MLENRKCIFCYKGSPVQWAANHAFHGFRDHLINEIINFNYQLKLFSTQIIIIYDNFNLNNWEAFIQCSKQHLIKLVHILETVSCTHIECNCNAAGPLGSLKRNVTP